MHATGRGCTIFSKTSRDIYSVRRCGILIIEQTHWLPGTAFNTQQQGQARLCHAT
jgi:hypothetical protein